MIDTLAGEAAHGRGERVRVAAEGTGCDVAVGTGIGVVDLNRDGAIQGGRVATGGEAGGVDRFS